jgi:D-alanine transaminase
VKGGVVAAPPQDNLILLGITYDLLVRLAGEGTVKLEIRPITEAQLRGADEVWLSSSTKEVLAVTTIDGEPVGGGRPGAVFKRMHALFQEHKAQARHRGAVAA